MMDTKGVAWEQETLHNGLFMLSKRRAGPVDSEVRDRLVHEALNFMREEGIANLSARRVAERIGLKGAIIHYYFPTIDDLIIAAAVLGSESITRSIEESLKEGNPLKTIWQLGSAGAAIDLEFTAYGMRRPKVGALVRDMTIKYRRMFVRALERDLDRRGIRPPVTPVQTVMLLQSLSQTIAIGRGTGMTDDHDSLTAMVDAWIDAYTAHGILPGGIERLP